MPNVNVNIRMDAELKKQFEAFCADIGMTMTTAINVFVRKAVRENRIPFEVGGNVLNAEILNKVQEDEFAKMDFVGELYPNIEQMMLEFLEDA